MLIQRKLLTSDHKHNICMKYNKGDNECLGCPLKVNMFNQKVCGASIGVLENLLKTYWNEEIEV